MKRSLLSLAFIAFCLLAASSARAQAGFAQGIAWSYTPAGAFPAGSSSVTICTTAATGTPCTPKVTVYQDAALSVPVANPLAQCTLTPQVGCLDNLGNFTFYATGGAYTYTIVSASGLSSYGPIPIMASYTAGGTASSLVGPGTISGTFTGNGSLSLSGTLTSGSINGILVVDGVRYTTIQGAVNALPLVNGKPAGTVYVPNSITIAAGQEVTIGPFTKLMFSPTNSVTYSGTGTAFTCNDAPTTYGGDGGLYNLDLNVTNNAGSGLTITECTWFHLSQVSISGPGAASTGIPILLQNTSNWTEQSDFNLVHVSNFNKPITFQDNCGGHAGCPSFAYARWRHVVASPVGAGGKGFELQNDSSWNGSDLDLQCFGGASAVTCLSLINTSSIQLIRLKIGGETSGAASLGISTAAGTTFSPISLWERWNAGTWTDSLSGTQIPYLYTTLGNGALIANPKGLRIGNTSNAFDTTLDSTSLSTFRTHSFPDATGTFSLAKVEDCGATTGGTQACAKTVKLLPLVVFGDVTLNTATTQSITTLPFTSAASYSCSGSDLTTAAGIVSFNTYAAASVTIAESGGVNTDHLRYMCAGF